MSTGPTVLHAAPASDPSLSLYHRLAPDVLANPYPLYYRLRTEDPVHWDPYLHAWIVTRYADVVTVLRGFSAARMPTPERLTELGLSEMNPIAKVVVGAMIFMDAPGHERLRGLAAAAFTNRTVESLRAHIREITNHLIDDVLPKGHMDVIADLADVLPAIVTAELMGVPTSDRNQLNNWSKNFSEVLGGFQMNPDRTPLMLETIDNMIAYFRDQMREQQRKPREGLVHALMTSEKDGDRLTEDEVIATCIITMTGGQETTTNLIGNGLLTLLKNPQEFARLQADPSLMPSAIEELLRYESPIQHTGRLALEDMELGGKKIRKRAAVLAVIGAANRDPERFPDPDRLDLGRKDNQHLAFGWGPHLCFGASLGRAEGQIALSTLFGRLKNLALEPEPIVWQNNMGFRGLVALPVTFAPAAPSRH